MPNDTKPPEAPKLLTIEEYRNAELKSGREHLINVLTTIPFSSPDYKLVDSMIAGIEVLLGVK